MIRFGKSSICSALVGAFCAFLWLVQIPAFAAERGVVATVHPLATEAALDAMRRGGNAVDAVVTAGLVLGVVDSHNSGLGGGCFLLIRRANGYGCSYDNPQVTPNPRCSVTIAIAGMTINGSFTGTCTAFSSADAAEPL